jgi:hypothetical protein
MRIFTVDFVAIYPVPCGLVIAANDIDEATMIARETITHTTDFTVTEVDISKPVVVFYSSGEY